MGQALEVPQGRTAIYNGAVVLDSVPVNLTGCSLWFTVKELRSDADADAVITKILGSGITLTDGPGGTFQVALSPADCALILTRKHWFWDVVILFPSGQVHTPTGMSGDIIAAATVRRSAA